MKKTVGLVYDLRSDYVFKDGDPADADAEFDKEDTIGHIEQALSSGGHEVVRIGNIHHLLKRIDKLSVDIIFNVAEGVGLRNRESQVPVILEMHDIPYVGSDGLTLALTLDKIMTKRMMALEGIPTPKYAELMNPVHLNGLVDAMRFPMIVKPRHEGTSKGITQDAKVADVEALKRRAQFVVDSYKQPAIVEEFIRGKEFTIALIGNEPDIEALPPVQVMINKELNLGEEFFTHARVYSNELEYICPAKVSEKLNQQLKDLALKTYRAVECKDFGRVDIRTDEDDRPYVLEINPLPSLSVEDTFMTVTTVMGVTYADIINRILDTALKRYGLN